MDLPVLDIAGDLGADLGPAQPEPGKSELLNRAVDSGPRHPHGRSPLDRLLQPLAGRFVPVGAEEIRERLRLLRVFRVERDTHLGQRRRNVGDGGLDRRLLDLKVTGQFQRVLVIRGQSEGGAGLLDRRPRLLLLLNGDFQGVVPLVEHLPC